MNINTTLIYDQIAHPEDFKDSQRVDCMHSEFKSSLKHDEWEPVRLKATWRTGRR